MSFAGFTLNSTLFLAFAVVGLATCVIVEQAQLLVKYRGVRQARVAGGYNDAMKIMVLNRLGTVLYFLFIALAIDLGADAATLARYFLISFALIAASNVAVVVMFWRKFKLKLGTLLASDVRRGPVVAAFFATVFGLFGLTIPMLLSAQNPALRLTMANTGFVFNSVFTIITVFFVENYLARLIDRKTDDDETTSFVALVSIVRLLSALVCIGLMVLISYNSDLMQIRFEASLATPLGG